MDFIRYSKIYRITSDFTEKIYIGSSCSENLDQVLAKHINAYKNYLKRMNEIKDSNIKTSGYCPSFEIIKLGNCKILLIETMLPDNRYELMARLQQYIDKYRAICINKNICNPALLEEMSKKINKPLLDLNLL